MIAESPSAVDCSLTITIRAGFVHAYVEGPSDTADIGKYFWKESLDRCATEGISRLLVEENLGDSSTASEAYAVGKFIADCAPVGLRVAMVDRVPDHQELNRFSLLVAANRGLVAQVFDSVSEAEQWLLDCQE